MLPRAHYWLLIALAVLVVGGGWIGASRVRDPRQVGTAPRAGFEAPDFALRTLEDQEIRLAALRGRPVLINFWATWCEPCRAEMPAIRAISRRYEADGLVVLLVNNRESSERISAYLQEVPVDGPVLLDADGAVHARYRVQAMPTTYFIDAGGRISDVTIGGPMTEAYLRSRLDGLVGR